MSGLALGRRRWAAAQRSRRLLSAPADPFHGMPTLPEPAPGSVLASGGSIASAISSASSGATIYLASGGSYALTGTTTMPDTKPNLKIVTEPGGVPATITGNFQFRMYGAGNQLWRVKVNQGWVAGKNIEIGNRDCAIVSCDLTNNFCSGAPTDSSGWSSMILTTASGPAGLVQDFLMYDCYLHQIGRQTDTHDHGIYLSDLNGGVLHSNRSYQCSRGGWMFHGYPNTKNVEIAWHRHEDGGFAILWEDTALQTTGNSIHHCAWTNAYAGTARAPVNASVNASGGNSYNRNAGQNSSGFGGTSGIDFSGLTAQNNLVALPQFANPAADDFTIGNQAVLDHLAVA